MFKLIPYISSTIWGGRRLIDEYGIHTDKKNAAEAWVLSCNPSGESTVADGEFKGKTLQEVYAVDKGICGENGEAFSEFPILTKFIDARDNLSVQVHPDEEYARRVEGGSGKTECWYILDCDDGAELILGFKDKISKETFKQSIEDGTLENYIEKIKVKKGDFFFIESGTLHAICKGILLAEVQQNSATTYRIYDYNRIQSDGKPRELHVSKAVDVTKLEKYECVPECEECKENLLYTEGYKQLVKCNLFSVGTVKTDSACKGTADKKSFVSLVALEGTGTVECGNESLTMTKGESLFIPAGSGEYTVSGGLFLLETRI